MNTKSSQYHDVLTTVIIPVYKPRPEFLVQAISSVCLQTLDKSLYHVFLCFDGPHDKEFIDLAEKSFFNNVSHSIKILPENLGLTGVLNYMMKNITSPYFSRFDCDDIMHPDRLKLQLDFLQKTGADLCGSRLNYIDSSSEILPQPRLKYPTNDFLIRLAGSLYNNPLAHPSVSGKLETIARLKYYSDPSPYEDYSLWSRYSSNYVLHNLPANLLYYRKHSLQITSHSTAPANALRTIRIRFLINLLMKYPLALFMLPLLLLFTLFPLKSTWSSISL